MSLKRTRLRRSRKRKRPSKQLLDWRRRHANARCCVGLPQCWGEATDPHHRKPRSVGGDDEDGNLRPTCRSCHAKYHEIAGQHMPSKSQIEAWLEVGTKEMLPEEVL